MKRCVSVLKATILAASSLGILIAANKALATPLIEVNPNSSVTIQGAYLYSPLNKSNPAVYQVYAGTSECLVLDVTLPSSMTTSNDLKLSLLAPNGTFWRNDDRSSSDRRPLIKAVTSGAGWYTVAVSHYSGGGVNTNFSMSVGRYSGSSTNCSSPTPITASQPSLQKR